MSLRKVDLKDPNHWHKECLRLYDENANLSREVKRLELKTSRQEKEIARVNGDLYHAQNRTDRLMSTGRELEKLASDAISARATADCREKRIGELEQENSKLKEKLAEVYERCPDLKKALAVQAEKLIKPSPLRMRSFGLFTMWKEFGRADE